MTDKIKEILDYLSDNTRWYRTLNEEEHNIELYKLLLPDERNNLLDYITTLQEDLKVACEVIEKLKNDKKKAIEYSKNCLENIKDQDQYMCESIDIVSLLQMIHKNYLDILQGDDN